jgi:hypothetical protein
VKDHHGAGNGLPYQHGQNVGQFDEGSHAGKVGWGCDSPQITRIS